MEGSACGFMWHTIIYANFDITMQELLGFFKGGRHCAPVACKDTVMDETLTILVLIYSWK